MRIVRGDSGPWRPAAAAKGAAAGWASAAGMILALLLSAGGGAALAAEDCAACHEPVAAKFAATPHGRAFAFDKEAAGATCESCHGPGAEHAEAGGDKTRIFNPLKAEPEKTNEKCLSCHENHAATAHWQGSRHESAGLRCTDCHKMHEAVPERIEGTRTFSATDACLSCHPTQRKGMAQRSRHPLLEGKMACASCHNPHGTLTETLLKADSINDLCYSCHAEKRGPFLWEHAPVRESCATCHTPHGSNHESLLVTRTAQLCQSCHLQGRHQTVAGTSTAFWNVNRRCASCHPQIHGSNHPSGPLFQR